jgi:hypothetical protein
MTVPGTAAVLPVLMLKIVVVEDPEKVGEKGVVKVLVVNPELVVDAALLADPRPRLLAAPSGLDVVEERLVCAKSLGELVSAAAHSRVAMVRARAMAGLLPARLGAPCRAVQQTASEPGWSGSRACDK